MTNLGSEFHQEDWNGTRTSYSIMELTRNDCLGREIKSSRPIRYNRQIDFSILHHSKDEIADSVWKRATKTWDIGPNCEIGRTGHSRHMKKHQWYRSHAENQNGNRLIRRSCAKLYFRGMRSQTYGMHPLQRQRQTLVTTIHSGFLTENVEFGEITAIVLYPTIARRVWMNVCQQ
jgi:hypothetical protein